MISTNRRWSTHQPFVVQMVDFWPHVRRGPNPRGAEPSGGPCHAIAGWGAPAALDRPKTGNNNSNTNNRNTICLSVIHIFFRPAVVADFSDFVSNRWQGLEGCWDGRVQPFSDRSKLGWATNAPAGPFRCLLFGLDSSLVIGVTKYTYEMWQYHILCLYFRNTIGPIWGTTKMGSAVCWYTLPELCTPVGPTLYAWEDTRSPLAHVSPVPHRAPQAPFFLFPKMWRNGSADD